ncbi:unnamed protein product, partial [Linum tenue]
RRRAHVAAVASEKKPEPESTPTPFTKEQAGALEKFFKAMTIGQPSQQNQAGMFTSMFANQGKQFTALSVQSTSGVKWIVDSGCSDHMTGNKELLSDYQRYPTKAGVRIADGSLSPVEGIGRIRLNQRKAPGGRLELLKGMRTSSSLKDVVMKKQEEQGGL